MIDKNIPPPTGRGGRNRSNEFPLREMEVGDSYFHAGDFNSTIESRAYRAAAMIQRRQKEYKFVGRAVDENGVSGVRIWRVPAEAIAEETSAPEPKVPAETPEEMAARFNARFKNVRHPDYSE
jgi:hypothetical protein